MNTAVKLLTITCVVISQQKYKENWLTTCKPAADEVSQVILPKQIELGQSVSYTPRMTADEDYEIGEIVQVGAPASESLSEHDGKQVPQ